MNHPTISSPRSTRIAVIGSGIAGAACGAALQQAGLDVTVFDKSNGVGGRMATRRAEWAEPDGRVRAVSFDHGVPGFEVTGPRFRAVVDHAVACRQAFRWSQRLHAEFPAGGWRDVIVPSPDMPTLSRHLLDGVPLRLGHAVTRLLPAADGWHLTLANGRDAGPFERVVIAIPPAQAALLLAGHRDDWSTALAAIRMAPCWSLMAATDDLDWPWDAAVSDRGPLALVVRDDRKPGRPAADGVARWVAHATSEWSTAYLEDDAASVAQALAAALDKLLPASAGSRRWHHLAAHRWRYANRPATQRFEAAFGWDAKLSIGVCGDAFGDGTLEGAWESGDTLGAVMVAACAASVAASVSAPIAARAAAPAAVSAPLPMPPRAVAPVQAITPVRALAPRAAVRRVRAEH